jgi:hypothetical protein
MTSDGFEVKVREDANEEIRTAAELAVAGAAAIGRLQTEEMVTARETQEAALRAMVGDAQVAEPSESELRQAREMEQALRESIEASSRYLPGTEVSLRLHEHTHFKFPPYDTEWRWGNAGMQISDLAGGFINIEGHSARRNPINSACGIGVTIRSDTFALVQVRPYVQYKWRYYATSDPILSHASTTGGVDLSAWRGPTIASPVKRAQLFHRRVSVGETRAADGEGVVFPPDYTVDFSVIPNDEYTINIGAWVQCEHTGGVTSSPLASALGWIEAHVRWVVIERFVGG